MAAQSRPGSLEARHVHGCTCLPATPEADRARRWHPDLAIDWVDVLTFDCPAHGELMVRAEKVAQEHAMERLRRNVLAGMGTLPLEEPDNDNGLFGGVKRDNDPVRLSSVPEPGRSIRARLWDAVRGALNGWRGWV